MRYVRESRRSEGLVLEQDLMLLGRQPEQMSGGMRRQQIAISYLFVGLDQLPHSGDDLLGTNGGASAAYAGRRGRYLAKARRN